MSRIDAHMGRRIAKRRSDFGWILDQLPVRTGLPIERLPAYEAGQRRAAAAELLTLGDALHVIPGYFSEDAPDEPGTLGRASSAGWLKDSPQE